MATSKQIEYIYDATLEYINGKERINIQSSNIHMIAIDYDYEGSNIPIMLVKCNVLTSLYNKLILNSTAAKMYMRIRKYDMNDSNAAHINYIEDTFSYLLSSNEEEYEQDDIVQAKATEASYRTIGIGLLKTELTDSNKMIINNVFMNTNKISIVHNYTKHMNMVIEPFDYNEDFAQLIVPPMESTVKFIQFMNNVKAFYKTQYRYFLDYNATYLLSSKGDGISVKDGSYSTIKINIESNEAKANIHGQILDVTNKIYKIIVNSKATSIFPDKVTEKKYNKLIGVTSEGKTKQITLNINKSDGSSEKAKIMRIGEDNLNILHNYANNTNSSALMMSVSKVDVDASIFVPYKEFQISHVSDYKEYDGKYILISKKEAYAQESGTFRCTVILTFKKA